MKEQAEFNTHSTHNSDFRDDFFRQLAAQALTTKVKLDRSVVCQNT